MTHRRLLLPVLLATAQFLQPAYAASEEGDMRELRNTVINLLQGLVDRGVLTREQAESMVRDAQTRAAADAAADAALAAEEKDAVRVPYVPEVVKQELRREIAAELGAEVTRNVIEAGQSEGWASPGALPDWIKRLTWTGDVRVRAQGDLFAADNVINNYLDFQRVNERGGIGEAGLDAFINTSEDRQRARARLRLGFEASLGYGWNLGARITTGNLRDSVSTNQTLGTTSGRYTLGVDTVYIQRYSSSRTGRQLLDLQVGRIRNPWQSTDLLWDQDLAFEGVAANYRLGLTLQDPADRHVFATAGAFALQEVELAADKWLVGGQLGLNWKFWGGSRLRLAGGYYDFRNVAGQRNTFDSELLDHTAPQFLQRGNTLFDIRNDNDPNTNLFALAADYRILDVTATFDMPVGVAHKVSFIGDYVRNMGFDARHVFTRTGFTVERRNVGYQGEIAVGSASMAAVGAWRAYAGYRYLQRDAVLDAFTDSDFRLGGTDVKGYFLGGEYAFSPRTNLRLRYMSGDPIDGPPLGIDVLQLDLNASF